jgi:hypothetical protein
METVEKSNRRFFHRSHRTWKTLRKSAPGFPQFPQPLLLDINIKNKMPKPRHYLIVDPWKTLREKHSEFPTARPSGGRKTTAKLSLIQAHFLSRQWGQA